jgi:hypothetical protein
VVFSKDTASIIQASVAEQFEDSLNGGQVASPGPGVHVLVLTLLLLASPHTVGQEIGLHSVQVDTTASIGLGKSGHASSVGSVGHALPPFIPGTHVTVLVFLRPVP